MQVTLVISGILSLVSGMIYGYVGIRLRRRAISSAQAQRAWGLFTLWWYCLAITTFIGGLLSLAGALGLSSLSLFIGITYINLLLICIALWGLLYYLFYLFSGSSRSLPFLTLFYVAYFIMLVYYVTASDPISVKIGRWDASLVYRDPITGPLFTLVLILLVFPQIIGGAAYFTLYFRLHDATQKYRILLVSWCIILWFLSAFAASITGLATQDWWQVTSRLIGIAAATGILAAYLPPSYFKERFGVKSISDEPH